jgi:transposase
MIRDDAIAILDLDREEAIVTILALAEKAEKYDSLLGQVSPTTPSGMTAVYLKPSHQKRKKPPGRGIGHPGTARQRPPRIDQYQEHILDRCPECQSALGKSLGTYHRYIEDLPPVQPTVTEHTIHRYWCPQCKKIVSPTVTDALPNAMIGLRLVVLTAWLHYLVGVSVNNLVKTISVFSSLKITAGGLTQAWKKLAFLLEPLYDEIGRKISQSAVLSADETGWRLNGVTHWLWGFATSTFCYYRITKSRASPVVKEVLGRFFQGILICDFWGAYNKISALAKQRCFYHLFTELVKVDQHNASSGWKAFRKKLSRLLKDAVRLSEKRNQLRPEVYPRLKQKLNRRLTQFLAYPYQDRDAKRLLKRLKRHQRELFTFLEFEGVSPYNNHAEQQMRPPVLARRVSQQNRSKEGAQTQSILMTLFRSAHLQGHNPVEIILSTAKEALEARATDEILNCQLILFSKS